MASEVDDAAGNTGNAGSEQLACVSCRSRKLKCDRVRPICTRCNKANVECVYPESRRKPAFKRRNVRELEARLAQVEGLLLKDAAKLQNGVGNDVGAGGFDFGFNNDPETVNLDSPSCPESAFPLGLEPETGAGNGEWSAGKIPGAPAPPQELMNLGLFEALPPFEVMEELNKLYFERQHAFIPIIHPGRYIQSFYSAPHLRPPMSLQYAIWTLASNGHEKYRTYHDVFYRRARHYLETDEMRDFGEHFITIQHCQAWALIGSDEARQMLFTRAAMSSAKAIRLAQVMGLHRLDSSDGPEDSAPALIPPRSWSELEERRRTFWGCFCIDSHASMSTGWPTLIDPTEISTHLPSSEEAFMQEIPEKNPTLTEALDGAVYSSFASACVVCHIFIRILKHVHRPSPADGPDDFENGRFWKRHRDLDNTLSKAFMFLPDRFRLPRSLRDPVAVHTNLNLHAAIICLHHASTDAADQHDLAEDVKRLGKARLKTSAEEVVNILKLSSHVSSSNKSPLVALAIYCSASVYLCQAVDAMDQPQPLSDEDSRNLELLVKWMELISRNHIITRAFLMQVCRDIEDNNLEGVVRLPDLNRYRRIFGSASSSVPLLARNRLSRRKGIGISPVLPGRLPLGKPLGSKQSLADANMEAGMDIDGDEGGPAVRGVGGYCSTLGGGDPKTGRQASGYAPVPLGMTGEAGGGGPNKRKRTTEPPVASTNAQTRPGVPGDIGGGAGGHIYGDGAGMGLGGPTYGMNPSTGSFAPPPHLQASPLYGNASLPHRNSPMSGGYSSASTISTPPDVVVGMPCQAGPAQTSQRAEGSRSGAGGAGAGGSGGLGGFVLREQDGSEMRFTYGVAGAYVEAPQADFGSDAALAEELVGTDETWSFFQNVIQANWPADGEA